MDEESTNRLEKLIFEIAYFYKGGVTIDWLENQPITKVLRIEKQLGKILKKMQPKESNGL